MLECDLKNSIVSATWTLVSKIVNTSGSLAQISKIVQE